MSLAQGQVLTLADVAQAVMTSRGPDARVDRMVGLAFEAWVGEVDLLHAAFARWATRDTPRYTSSLEDARSLGAKAGVRTSSRRFPYGFAAVAEGPDGSVEEACGHSAAAAETAALLIFLRRWRPSGG